MNIQIIDDVNKQIKNKNLCKVGIIIVAVSASLIVISFIGD